jgi:hypothetical protein
MDKSEILVLGVWFGAAMVGSCVAMYLEYLHRKEKL